MITREFKCTHLEFFVHVWMSVFLDVSLVGCVPPFRLETVTTAYRFFDDQLLIPAHPRMQSTIRDFWLVFLLSQLMEGQLSLLVKDDATQMRGRRHVACCCFSP